MRNWWLQPNTSCLQIGEPRSQAMPRGDPSSWQLSHSRQGTWLQLESLTCACILVPWHQAGQQPDPWVLCWSKKKVALGLWREKSLVLHRLCTLRCSGLPKFPSQFWMEVKLLCAVKTGREVAEGGG